MIIERRSITRRRSLEEHMQAAIDAVRGDNSAELIAGAVSDAMAAVERLPVPLQGRGRKALRLALAGPQEAARKPALSAREVAEGLFKGRAA